jgi:drug/metabolite transporter (DMT)-like permease
MEHVDASHGGVVAGILPLVTALAAVVVSGDQPSPKFWFFAALGSLSVAAFSVIQGAG